MKATRVEKCQSLEHILLFHNDIVQNHDTLPPFISEGEICLENLIEHYNHIKEMKLLTDLKIR